MRKLEENNKKVEHGLKLNIVELYAGAAGLAQGFMRRSEFNLLGLTDYDVMAYYTFTHNYPHIPYIIKDIKELKEQEFHEAIGGDIVHGLLGGPPCQGFSMAGKRCSDDERNMLALEYIRFVNYFDPDFLVIENVPQFLNHSVCYSILQRLSKNYNVCYGILHSALYGTPQTRLRAVIIAFNKRTKIMPVLPKPTHGPIRPVFGYRSKKMLDCNDNNLAEILGINATIRLNKIVGLDCKFVDVAPLVTVEEAIGDLPGLQAGEFATTYSMAPFSDYQRKLRRNFLKLSNHFARNHEEDMLELLRNLPEGGNLADLDKRFHPAKNYSQAYSRLHRNGLARTITNSFHNPGSGRYTHYRDDRALTVREAARLQGFDDSFEFLGNSSEQLKYVGNAVPIPLSETIANQIINLYLKNG